MTIEQVVDVLMNREYKSDKYYYENANFNCLLCPKQVNVIHKIDLLNGATIWLCESCNEKVVSLLQQREDSKMIRAFNVKMNKFKSRLKKAKRMGVVK